MRLQLIETTRIVEDPDQPRRVLDDTTLASLADSIRQHGILNPITVVPLEGVDAYRIVTGERRWRASQLAGLFEMPCIVRDAPAADAAERTTEQLIENLQREELAPLDKANAIKALKEALGATNKEIGQRLGMSERSVGYMLDLLDLPEAIGEQIVSSPNRPADGNLTEKHGRFLRQLNDQPDLQNHLVEKIRDEKLSSDDTARLARALKENPELREQLLEGPIEDLQKLLGGGSGKGTGGGRGFGGGGGGREFTGEEGGYDGGPYANLDEKPLFSKGRAMVSLVERVLPMLSEVNVGAVTAAELPALEAAAREVKASIDTLLASIQSAKRS
jgi:ParB family chromosome partitioning protein